MAFEAPTSTASPPGGLLLAGCSWLPAVEASGLDEQSPMLLSCLVLCCLVLLLPRAVLPRAVLWQFCAHSS